MRPAEDTGDAVTLCIHSCTCVLKWYIPHLFALPWKKMDVLLHRIATIRVQTQGCLMRCKNWFAILPEHFFRMCVCVRCKLWVKLYLQLICYSNCIEWVEFTKFYQITWTVFPANGKITQVYSNSCTSFMALLLPLHVLNPSCLYEGFINDHSLKTFEYLTRSLTLNPLYKQ